MLSDSRSERNPFYVPEGVSYRNPEEPWDEDDEPEDEPEDEDDDEEDE